MEYFHKMIMKKYLFKRFLKTYMKDLGLLEECDIENLFINSSIDIKSSGVSLDNNKTSSNKFGSLIILVSLIFIGLLFLFWNRDTYYRLFELEKLLK